MSRSSLTNRRANVLRFARRGRSRASLHIESLEGRCLLSGGVVEYSLTPGSGPLGITAGPDGNLWFAERDGNKIGRMNTRGQLLNEFPIPTPGSWASNITVGSDGNLWFNEQRESGRPSNKIGRIDLNGVITEFTASVSSQPLDITAGPDGGIWFTEHSAGRIGRLSPLGTDQEIQQSVTECPFQIPNALLQYITPASDGSLWFSDERPGGAARVWRITTECEITDTLDLLDAIGSTHVTDGPDGNVWYAQFGARVGRIDVNPPHTITGWGTEPVGGLTGITAAPDGNLWFLQDTNGTPDDKLQRVTPDGRITVFTLPGRKNHEIAVGPDGNLWYTSHFRDRVGKFYLLWATGLTLEDAVAAGQPLQAVVANFRDDEPGMLCSHYQVDIDWGDGSDPSSGQAWRTEGVGNWVATGGHTYAKPGEYWITVTITDTHAPTGMTTTTYSYVQVLPSSGPGGGGDAGWLPPDVVAALMREKQVPVMPTGAAILAAPEPRNTLLASPNASAAEDTLTPSRIGPRNADAWLSDVLVEVLAADLLPS